MIAPRQNHGVPATIGFLFVAIVVATNFCTTGCIDSSNIDTPRDTTTSIIIQTSDFTSLISTVQEDFSLINFSSTRNVFGKRYVLGGREWISLDLDLNRTAPLGGVGSINLKSIQLRTGRILVDSQPHALTAGFSSSPTDSMAATCVFTIVESISTTRDTTINCSTANTAVVRPYRVDKKSCSASFSWTVSTTDPATSTLKKVLISANLLVSH